MGGDPAGRQPEREVLIEVEPDVQIRYLRSEAPPPVSYAVTLEVELEGSWTTVRLWDNAHALDEHHEHVYTREKGKQDPTVHEFASGNEAMAAAIGKAKRNASEIVKQWRAS